MEGERSGIVKKRGGGRPGSCPQGGVGPPPPPPPSEFCPPYILHIYAVLQFLTMQLLQLNKKNNL